MSDIVLLLFGMFFKKNVFFQMWRLGFSGSKNNNVINSKEWSNALKDFSRNLPNLLAKCAHTINLSSLQFLFHVLHNVISL
jgi:hypothetical protein